MSGGDYSLDNISLNLQPEPEPDSFALPGLGLTGLLVSRRRRNLPAR